jgi:hypothetical protein
MTGENSLYNEFKLNSSLLFNAGFGLTELNDMLPFERNTYLQLWNQHVEEKEKEKNKNKNGGLNF